MLDGFAGSGSTLIACEKTGRLARLVEIDPHYVDVIVRRWQAYTGQQAILEGDGRAFDEIAVERHTVNRREQPARDPDGTIASSELEGTDTENGV